MLKLGSLRSNGNAKDWVSHPLLIGPSTVSSKEKGSSKKTPYTPKGVSYPYFRNPLGCNNIHQADLVGPRYIKNDGRFFSLNIIDLYSHRVFLHPQRTKNDQAVARGLIRCWKTLGIPDFLQFDNELAFRGSNRYPRSFGIVLRLCLSLGIEAVFIPIGEPWRNGTIESFNDTYDQRFFRAQWFRSYRHLRSQSRNFELHHNMHHRYSYLKGKTPCEVIEQEQFRPIVLPPRFKLPEISDIPDGTISLIRFIRSDQVLEVFGEHFRVPRDLVYTYVRARIVTALHQIQVYSEEELALCLPYQLPSSLITEP
jgi:putative transposase